MAEIVNLNRAKKAAEKRLAAQQARENRARFGRTKAERARDERDAADRERLLDNARQDPVRDR